MRLTLHFLLVPVFAVLLSSCTKASASSSDSFATEAQRFIVSSVSVDQLESLAKAHNLQVVKRMKLQKSLVIHGSERAIAELAKEAHGTYEPDGIYSIPDYSAKVGASNGTTQPIQSKPWGITTIRSDQAFSRGEGIIVCVSDTGIALSHPDLKANIVGSFNTISATQSAEDDNGHGTHVAGTIAAIDNAIGVVGVAPAAKLLAAKGLDRSGSGFASDLAETIDECRVRGARVINMSWGSSSPSQTIYDAIIRAYDSGIILVAAAGNNSGPVGYPAAFPQVVAVSATDSNEGFATFSSFGVEVGNSAPGVGILSTWRRDKYATLSGTSMASPHVAGVAALMLSSGAGTSALHLLGLDIGLPREKQGSRGRIDAVLSTIH